MSIVDPSRYTPEELAMLEKLIPHVEEGVSKILTKFAKINITPEDKVPIKLPRFENESSYRYFLDFTKNVEQEPLTWAEHRALQVGIMTILQKLGWMVETVLIKPSKFIEYLNEQENKNAIQEGEAE
jgi:hypothetical protein